tara:strand:- start:423 stop:1037 length:615 start_codon:yes stop_codon:yes gene_type:complete
MSKIIVKDLAGPASSSNKIFIASGSELDIANSSGTINLAVDAGDIASGTLGTGRFPSDSIVFTQFAEISADSTITADGGTTFVDATGFTITVASADAAKCSKLIVTFVSGFRVNQATYTFGEARIQRSAPGTAVDGDRMGFGTADANDVPEIYDCVTNVFVDDSLGSGDHTYKLQYRAYGGTDIYAGTMYPRNSAGRITVIGVK